MDSAEIHTLYTQNVSCNPTGVSYLSPYNEISLFPTISENGLFKLNVGELRNNISLRVINNLGQEINFLEFSQTNGSIDLNFSELSKGIYFLEINNNLEGEKRFKFAIK